MRIEEWGPLLGEGPLYALSLHQPWASLLGVLGKKRSETRSWPTRHRGLLLIHAARTWRARQREVCEEKPFREVLEPYLCPEGRDRQEPGCYQRRLWLLPRGAFVGPVQIGSCLPSERGEPHDAYDRAFGDFSPGRFLWPVQALWRLPTPIPARGFQRLWEVEEEVRDRVLQEAERVV